MNNETLYTYKFTCTDSEGKAWIKHHDFWSPMDQSTLEMLLERYKNYSVKWEEGI